MAPQICILWQDDGWLQRNDAAKSRVKMNLAILVGEALKSCIGYGR